MRVIVLIVTASLLAVGLPSAVHGAGAQRYTRGDAEAMLNTYPPGNATFWRLPTGLDIRPFQEFYGGVPYCVEDWHVLALAYEDGEYIAPDFGLVHTHGDVQAFLRGLDSEFLLDRASVDVVKTPIKPFVDWADIRSYFTQKIQSLYGPNVTFGNLFGVQWGRILAPDELGAGNHTLRVIVTDAEQVVLFEGSVTFTVYPPESAACTGTD